MRRVLPKFAVNALVFGTSFAIANNATEILWQYAIVYSAVALALFALFDIFGGLILHFPRKYRLLRYVVGNPPIWQMTWGCSTCQTIREVEHEKKSLLEELINADHRDVSPSCADFVRAPYWDEVGPKK